MELEVTEKDVDYVDRVLVKKCLESIDELIAAETYKLELLKKHRLGLLQKFKPFIGV